MCISCALNINTFNIFHVLIQALLIITFSEFCLISNNALIYTVTINEH